MAVPRIGNENEAGQRVGPVISADMEGIAGIDIRVFENGPQGRGQGRRDQQRQDIAGEERAGPERRAGDDHQEKQPHRRLFRRQPPPLRLVPRRDDRPRAAIPGQLAEPHQAVPQDGEKEQPLPDAVEVLLVNLGVPGRAQMKVVVAVKDRVMGRPQQHRDREQHGAQPRSPIPPDPPVVEGVMAEQPQRLQGEALGDEGQRPRQSERRRPERQARQQTEQQGDGAEASGRSNDIQPPVFPVKLLQDTGAEPLLDLRPDTVQLPDGLRSAVSVSHRGLANHLVSCLKTALTCQVVPVQGRVMPL